MVERIIEDYRNRGGYNGKASMDVIYVRALLKRAREIERENADLRSKLEEARKDAQAMKAATYSHVDGRDLLHELQPNGAHCIDILVRINGQDRRYEGDWLKKLTWARDGHNMGEYADNPRLRAMIESRKAESSDAQEGMTGIGIDATIAAGKGEA